MTPHAIRLSSLFFRWLGEAQEKLIRSNRRNRIGEKRTGPALNPLKGSSARLPPPYLRSATSSPLLIRLFSIHSNLFLGKKSPTPPKNYHPASPIKQLAEAYES